MYQGKCDAWILHLLFLLFSPPLLYFFTPSLFSSFSFLFQFILPACLPVYIFCHSLGRKTTGCEGGICSNLSPEKTFVLIFLQCWGVSSHLRSAEIWLGPSCMHGGHLGGNQCWKNTQVCLLMVNSALTKSLQSHKVWERWPVFWVLMPQTLCHCRSQGPLCRKVNWMDGMQFCVYIDPSGYLQFLS